MALDGYAAREQVVLGDGAEWIKTQAALHFPEAVGILDWAHVARAVHKAMRAACPGPVNHTRRRDLHQQVPDLLWQGDLAGTLAQLRALRPAATADPVTVLEETRRYLEGQRRWLGPLCRLAGGWLSHWQRQHRARGGHRHPLAHEEARHVLVPPQRRCPGGAARPTTQRRLAHNCHLTLRCLTPRFWWNPQEASRLLRDCVRGLALCALFVMNAEAPHGKTLIVVGLGRTGSRARELSLRGVSR